jgi:hypothetical protein
MMKHWIMKEIGGISATKSGEPFIPVHPLLDKTYGKLAAFPVRGGC